MLSVVHWADVTRWLVIIASVLVSAALILILERLRTRRSWGRPPRSQRYSLRKLAAVLVTVLILDGVALLGAIGLPALVAVSKWGFLAAMVMFVVWFYRARVNAEGHGWPQRQSPRWAILAWVVPVLNFWVPFQIMADIWRAGLPEQARAGRALLPGIWWAFWLAFLCLRSFVPSGSAHLAWYAGMPIYGTGCLAVIMTALLVQKVSSGPLGESGWGLKTER
jgi:hypothetical protein